MTEHNNTEGFTQKEILIRLETKVDFLIQDHEQRIRSLERFRWALPASVFTTVAGIITALVISFTAGGVA